MEAITPHYIDGKIVEPHGREVMESINPTNNTVIGKSPNRLLNDVNLDEAIPRALALRS
jgi:acyl-CoA reductase-like NAD-dependent aldehyde dehydrogenase